VLPSSQQGGKEIKDWSKKRTKEGKGTGQLTWVHVGPKTRCGWKHSKRKGEGQKEASRREEGEEGFGTKGRNVRETGKK